LRKINYLEISAHILEKQRQPVGATLSKIKDLATYPPKSTQNLRCLCLPW